MKFPDDYNIHYNTPYADTDNPRQCLDIAIPKNKPEKPLPVIVFVHGGGWRAGSKDGIIENRLADFLNGRVIGISINYRLTDEAIWPAQIHDCKAAIRWIRGNAEKYNIDRNKICVWGSSAGGHLVAMLGVSSNDKTMKGTLGSHIDQRSDVSCVIDFCGPTQLIHSGFEQYFNDELENPLAKIFGGPPSENLPAMKSASPINYVNGDEPPFLMVHGELDNVVSLDQSILLDEALKKAGVSSTLIKIINGIHGFPVAAALTERIKQFLDKHLFDKDIPSPSTDPITVEPPE
jgi:acetyl esterase/lipase